MDDDKTRTYKVLSAGTRISHYEIIKRIGAGGMGEVYLAEDTSLHRKVALKFLPAQWSSDEELRKRFAREAEAAAQLNHPNIITIHEVGEYEGRPYFAMEMVEGQSLKEFAASGQASIEQVIELAIQILDGLASAHEKGVTHRDIKPSNILLDSYGRPKVLDFGLAAVKGSEQLTRTGSTFGTVQYMSPEQTRGEHVDHRSDLFSFGVVLYELVTGKNPFARENDMATGQAILSATPDPAARFRSGVPQELESIITKLLEKDPQLRYQTATGVIADFKRLAQSAGVAVSGVSVPPRRSKRRYWLPASFVFVAIVAVLILGPWKFEMSPTEEAVAADNRIAIMYFDNIPDPADTAKLGEIITNLLYVDLSESEYIHVMSSQRLYDVLKQMGREGLKKLDQKVASEVAKKAKCGRMLMGSILQAEPTFVVTSQLIDVKSGTLVASQRIVGDTAGSIFSVVDSLTMEIKRDLALPADTAGEQNRSVTDVTTTSAEAYRYYLEGLEFQNRHMMEDAQERYLKAIQLDSTFAMALCRLGWISSRGPRDKWIQSAVEYRDNVTERERWHIISRYYLNFGRLDKARGTLRKAVDKYPDDKEAWYDLGVVDAELGQIDSGITRLEHVIELDPFWGEAYNRLAYLYDRRGRYDEAIWAITENVRLAPDEPNPYDTRGELYALNGRLAEAKQSYRRALEIDSDFAYSISRLGELLALERKYDSAKIYFSKQIASERPNTRGQGRKNECVMLFLQGRLRQAFQELCRAEELDVKDGLDLLILDKRVWQAMVCSELAGDPDSISARWGDVLRTFRQKYPHWVPNDEYALSVAYLVDAGAVAKAEEILKTWEAHEGFIPDHRHDLARACLDYGLGNYDQAARLLDSTISAISMRQNWSYFWYSYWLGRSWLAAGQYDKAAQVFSGLSGLYSAGRYSFPLESVKLYYYLGRAHEAADQPEKAIAQYEEFLQWWGDGGSDLPVVEDTRQRLTNLKSSI